MIAPLESARAQACFHLYTVRCNRRAGLQTTRRRKKKKHLFMFATVQCISAPVQNTSMDNYNSIYHFGGTNDHLASFLLQYFNIYILNAGVKYSTQQPTFLFGGSLCCTSMIASTPPTNCAWTRVNCAREQLLKG